MSQQPQPDEEVLELRFESAGVWRSWRLRLDARQFSQQVMLNSAGHGSYESETAHVLLSTLRQGDLFVDVGAHVGYFSLLAGMMVGPSGQVLSFEPDSANFDHLLGHLQDNHLNNVRPMSWAVGDSTRIIDFYVNSDNDGGHAVWNPGNHSFNTLSRAHPRRRPAYQTTLDDALIGANLPIRAIKVDTEGNELAVMRGARRTLTETDPLVVLEINRFGLKQVGTTEQELRAYMIDLGFDAYALPSPGRLTRLNPDESLDTNEILNMAFVRPRLLDELMRGAANTPKWSLTSTVVR